MSNRSPKNKYSATIVTETPINDGGSNSSTITANTIEEIENLAFLEAQGISAHVTIKENKKEYPSSDCQIVKTYCLNK